jgi:hypothetical protein
MWIGVATGGLLWPIAFIWAFTKPINAKPESGVDDSQISSAPESGPAAIRQVAVRKTAGER